MSDDKSAVPPIFADSGPILNMNREIQRSRKQLVNDMITCDKVYQADASSNYDAIGRQENVHTTEDQFPDFRDDGDIPDQSSVVFKKVLRETEKLAKCMESLERVLNWIRGKHGEGEGNNNLPYEVLELVDPMFLVKNEHTDIEVDEIADAHGIPTWNYEEEPDPALPFPCSAFEFNANQSEIKTEPFVNYTEYDYAEEPNQYVDGSGDVTEPTIESKKPDARRSINKPRSMSMVKQKPKMKLNANIDSDSMNIWSEKIEQPKSGENIDSQQDSVQINTCTVGQIYPAVQRRRPGLRPSKAQKQTCDTEPSTSPVSFESSAVVQTTKRKYRPVSSSTKSVKRKCLKPRRSGPDIRSDSHTTLNEQNCRKILANSNSSPTSGSGTALPESDSTTILTQQKSGTALACTNSGTTSCPIGSGMSAQRLFTPIQPKPPAAILESSNTLTPVTLLPGVKQGQNIGPVVHPLIAVPNGTGQFLILQVMPTIVPKTVQCPTCDAEFVNKVLYKEHLREHRLASKKASKCKPCNLTFLNRGQYETHFHLQHKNPDGTLKFNCEKCDLIFNRSLSLREHVKTVHPSEPETFLCSSCGKSFTRKDGLKHHMDRMHAGERIYQCEFCPRKFVTLPGLNNHEARHRARKVQQSPCPHCGVMKHLNILKSHIEYVHEGKRFRCNFCDTLISQKGQIKSHLFLKHLDIAQTTSIADAARVIYVEPTHGSLNQKKNQGPGRSSGSEETNSNNPAKKFKSKPGSYICTICKVTFRVKRTLDVHRAQHAIDPNYRHRLVVKTIDPGQTSTPDTLDSTTTKQEDHGAFALLPETSKSSIIQEETPETDLISELQQAFDHMS